MISPLRGGGKLADKIFNKYNITKEEREEVKNEIANGGGGGGDSIFTEAYIKFKKEDYKDLALTLGDINLESLITTDGLKSITHSMILVYDAPSTPYGRFRFPINVLGHKINNLEEVKNMASEGINWNEEIEEITADEFYNFLNS